MQQELNTKSVNRFKKYYNSLALPAKATIWFTLCNVLIKGISFISAPIFASLLTQGEYGKLNVFASYEQLLLILATWEIQQGAYQKGLFNYKNKVKEFTTATQALVNVMTIVFFIFVFILYKPISQFTGMNWQLLVVMFFFILFQPSYNCWLTRKRTEYDYKPAVLMTIIYSLINVLVPIVFLLIYKQTAIVKMSSALIASAILCVFFFTNHVDYHSLILNKSDIKEMWRFLIVFEAPLVLHSLSYLVLNQADRVMIEKMVGDEQAAIYSVAYSIAMVVNLLQSSINQALLPWRYQMLEQNRYVIIKEITNKLLIVFSFGILAFTIVAPDIIRLMFQIEYHDAKWCVPPVAMGMFFMFLYTIFVNIESYFEKTNYIMYVSVVCGVINIILNYYGILRFGYIACAYTTLISYILFSFGHYYFMKKILKKKSITEAVVDPIAIIVISVLSVAASIAITLLYDKTLVRYCMLLILLGVCIWYLFKNKKQILSLKK